jgi:hypothetical protein
MKTTLNADELCRNTEAALSDVHEQFSHHRQKAHSMKCFWHLQDNLRRLVEAAADFRAETFCILETKHPGLVSRVVELLRRIETLQSFNNRAVNASCRAMHESLALLARLQQLQSKSFSG